MLLTQILATNSTNQHINLKKIPLSEGEGLKVEPAAMLACRNVELVTIKNGKSIMEIIKGYVLGGEGIFQNIYTAKEKGGWLALEESYPGQIHFHIIKPGETLTIGKGAFVACDINVDVSVKYAGFSGWWKGLGFSKLEATVINDKPGRIFFNSVNGTVKMIKVTEEEGPVIIDNDNIIAYTNPLSLNICKIGGLFSFMTSGEGTVNEVSGEGYVFVGSGESAARANVFENIVRIACETFFPDPVVLINRVTLVAITYILAKSPPMVALAESIAKLADEARELRT